MADLTEKCGAQSERIDTKAPEQPTSPPRTVPLRAYSHIRQDIMNGDVLMFRGDNFLSELIEVGTNSPYSHAGLAFLSDEVAPFRTPFGPGRVCVVEAVGAGIRMGLLSETVAGYHGAVELWRLAPDHRKRFHADKAVAEARRYVGRPYAFRLLVYFLLDLLTFKLFDLRSHTLERRSLFCSQLVSRAYVKGGVDLCKCYPDAATAPADLVKEGLIEFVHAFSKHDPLSAKPAPAGDALPARAPG